MNINKAQSRDSKINKRRYGHKEDGRSVKLIREIQKRRSIRLKREKEKKEELLNSLLTKP